MKKHLLIFAALVPFILTPANAGEIKNGTLTVTGTGTISKAPDMAIISAGVQSRAKNAETALDDNNTKMQALFAELEKAGIEKKDIQTDNFNIHPELFYPKSSSNNEPRPPQIVGYTVNNQVSVKIHKLDGVGSVLTALVNAGANNMSGLRFDISNKEELLDEARKAAVADARRKANIYATELGVEIDRLTSLSESGGYNPQPVRMRAMAMEAASPVPVAEGTVGLTVSVNTIWELTK